MKSKINLKWSDFVSPTMTSDDYLKIYGDQIKRNFESYEPKLDILENIKDFLKNKKEKLKIVALGADWCPDCSRNVPRMIKIVKEIKSEVDDMQILYGIMVNALHKPGETIWHTKRSPPEATDPKFELKSIPTFYFFNKAGEYLGVIVENPANGSTLEDDLLEILKRNM
ncbi:MAG: thioredoxin family protein [Candidatus Hodarchaeota archaeon]